MIPFRFQCYVSGEIRQIPVLSCGEIRQIPVLSCGEIRQIPVLSCGEIRQIPVLSCGEIRQIPVLKGIYPEFQVIRGFSQKIPAGLLSYDQIHR